MIDSIFIGPKSVTSVLAVRIVKLMDFSKLLYTIGTFLSTMNFPDQTNKFCQYHLIIHNLKSVHLTIKIGFIGPLYVPPVMRQKFANRLAEL